MKYHIVAVGAIALAAGILLSGIGIAVSMARTEQLISGLDLTDQTDAPSGKIRGIFIESSDAAVTVQQGDTFSVEAKNISVSHYSVTLEEEMLRIQYDVGEATDWKWWIRSHIQLNPFLKMPSGEIVVTLPAQSYQMLGAAVELGDCRITDFSGSTVSVDSQCGDVTLEQVDATACTVDADLGDVTMTDISIAGMLQLTDHCGDVTLRNTQVDRLCSVELQMGDMTSTNLRFGTLELDSDMGDVTLASAQQIRKEDNSQNQLTLDMGDLIIRDSTLYHTKMELDAGDLAVQKASLLGDSSVTVDMGDVSLYLKGCREEYAVLPKSYGAGAKNTIVVSQDMGDLQVSFTE